MPTLHMPTLHMLIKQEVIFRPPKDHFYYT